MHTSNNQSEKFPHKMYSFAHLKLALPLKIALTSLSKITQITKQAFFVNIHELVDKQSENSHSESSGKYNN